MLRARRRFRYPLFAVVAFIGYAMAVSAETAVLGPHTSQFNQRLMAKATNAGLLGQSCSAVESTLGSASFIWASRDAGLSTFNYWPWPMMPFKAFQVHCRDGSVTGLEMFDD